MHRLSLPKVGAICSEPAKQPKKCKRLPGHCFLYLLCRHSLSSVQSGLVVSSSLFGALAGSVGAFVFGDKLGRKRELVLASALYGNQQSVNQLNRMLFGSHRGPSNN